MKVLNFDITKCSGCRICELVCSFNKEKMIHPWRARISVISDHSVGLSIISVCQQCSDAPCIKICPSQALKKTPEGYVTYENQKCIGCKVCVVTCPFGAITYSPDEKKVFKCDLCDGKPLCAEFCPTNALTFSETEEYTSIKKHEYATKLLKTL